MVAHLIPQDQEMIVHPYKSKEPQFEDYIIGSYITPSTSQEHPETELSKSKLKCDKCGTTFAYEHTLNIHKSQDHLSRDLRFELFENFDYFGGVKKTNKIKPVTGPVEEVIIDHSKLKVVFMNVNSLVSPRKRARAKLAIETSKADIIIMAETKLGKKHTEFKVGGYCTAENLTRKQGAGGLVIMAKDQIKVHSITKQNVLPEIQVITFKVEKLTFISVYRSPNYGKTKARDHHRSLITYLDKEIDKLEGSKYVLVGDFNLPTLAENDFEPQSGSNDETGDPMAHHPDVGIENMTIEQMWADFYNRRYLEQWVHESTYWRYNSVANTVSESTTDLIFTPVTQDILQLKVDRELFQGNYDHFALVFTIETKYSTNETPRLRRVKNKENWYKFRELLISYGLLEFSPKDS